MSVGREQVDPGAIETFSLDFTDDLATGDTLSGAPTWTFETAEGAATTAPTKVAQSNTTTVALIRLSCSVEHLTFYAKCSAPTLNGDTLVKRLMFDVERE